MQAPTACTLLAGSRIRGGEDSPVPASDVRSRSRLREGFSCVSASYIYVPASDERQHAQGSECVCEFVAGVSGARRLGFRV